MDLEQTFCETGGMSCTEPTRHTHDMMVSRGMFWIVKHHDHNDQAREQERQS